jgi:hypothetical protein
LKPIVLWSLVPSYGGTGASDLSEELPKRRRTDVAAAPICSLDVIGRHSIPNLTNTLPASMSGIRVHQIWR